MNDLKNASSPYLIQHADNPVDWKEWSPELLKKAKQENKLLLISIGYAACHWCHVMEKNCFQDDEVARVMNRYFVSIKVDREERPDIDKIYMDAAQIINRQAGWPLNAFALPDGRPFFAGTYFPKDNWLEILEKIAEVYGQSPYKIEETANQVQQGLNSINTERFKVSEENKSHFDFSRYREIGKNWSNYVDFRFGGFKRAPKFPFPAFWSFLIQYKHLTNDKEALQALLNTLNQMIEGGIYDHLAGGFARYSVDEHWKVPHFEKMLYDNAQLIELLADAYKIAPQENYKKTIAQTVDFLDQELKATDQGYYSSINADSEGEEGRFYVWTKNEIQQELNNEEYWVFQAYYAISENGNWEDGKNVLHVHKKLDQVAKANQLSIDEVEKSLEQARQKLKAVRDKRVKPSCDDKQLTAWNAMLVSAFVKAYEALGEKQYKQKAIRLINFLTDKMIDDHGQLFRNFKNNKASIIGFFDDHAFLIKALIDVYQISFNINYLHKANELTLIAIDQFHGGNPRLFHYQNKASEKLITDSYEVDDNVIPSSNAVMAENLIELSAYFENSDYEQIAVNMMEIMKEEFSSFSPNIAKWMQVMGKLAHEPIDIAVTGKNSDKLANKLQMHYAPLARYSGGEKEVLPLLKGKIKADKNLIYVCKNKTCLAPVESVEAAVDQLN